MALLSAESFKLRYPALDPSGTDSDDEIEALATDAEALIALYLGYPEADDGTRSLGLNTYTFTLSGPALRQPLALCLCVRPIDEVVSVNVDPTWTYGATGLLVDGTDYVVDEAQGIVLLRPGGSLTTWPSAYRAIRVVVEAGYATLPAWLVPLVVATVRHLWDRRNIQGESSHSSFGDSASFVDTDALIPQAVRDLLAPLRMCA